MDVWKAAAKKLFGDLTFLEAYHRTGRILNISMTRADRYKERETREREGTRLFLVLRSPYLYFPLSSSGVNHNPSLSACVRYVLCAGG